jgi:hypothetical protein
MRSSSFAQTGSRCCLNAFSYDRLESLLVKERKANFALNRQLQQPPLILWLKDFKHFNDNLPTDVK